MQVFLVCTGESDDWRVEVVCATREIAETIVKECQMYDAQIQEWRVVNDINQII